MQEFKVSELTPHPQNEFYFDEMTGQKWEEFLESIRTSGVIEPPVVTNKRVIVSGHQRIRACKELGIESINCEVRIYDSEDRVLKDLIETNIRQRGTIAGSELKMGRIIKELERIYGIKNGVRNDRKLPQIAEAKSQDDLARELGISVDKLNRMKKLVDLPDEYMEMLESGRISANTAVSLISKLTDAEQQELLRALPATEKITQGVAQQYIDKIRGLKEDKATLEEERDTYAQEAEEAARAAKSATDSREYLNMVDKLKAEQMRVRELYEEVQKLKKKDRTEQAVTEATNKTKDEYRKLVDDQEKKIANLEAQVSQSRELKAKLEAIENSGNPDISKQILRVHTSNKTPEQILNSYEQRLLEYVGGFLSGVRGLEVELELCAQLPTVTKTIVRSNIEEIKQILSKMDNAIMGRENECKIA